ncbi:MAG: glutathione S-transferase [Alteromonadaceae bacterium]|jgi:glutathione S-transferase
MYTLYYSPGACSLATQVVLKELAQEVKIIDVNTLENFQSINPVATVPVLVDDDKILTEGAAIMLYILDKHKNSMLPSSEDARQKAIQNIMFANATMHPAYGRLFFLAQHIDDEIIKQSALNSAADSINNLWQVVEKKLTFQSFLGGDSPSAADIMLAVYSTWGQYFPVKILLGERTNRMLNAIQTMPNFIEAVAAEQVVSKK